MEKPEPGKIIAAMLLQLLFLIAGLTLIALGTNLLVSAGVFCLLLYNNMRSE